MTQRYSVSGTPDLSPDCTTADTGVAAGESNGHPYWRWMVDDQEWLLYKTAELVPEQWQISQNLGGAGFAEPAWNGPTGDVAGDYEPQGFTEATGTATVAEPEPEKLLVLEWLTGPHAGKYTLLKESL
jgi:hypothetical protein